MVPNHYQTESWATVTPADLLRSITRRLPSVLATMVCVMVLITCMLLAWPNQYASDGLFYARLGRGAVAMDPTTEPGRSVSLQESRSSEVMSISQMLNSREIMDRVVRSVGAEEINRPRNWLERTALKLGNLASRQSGKELAGEELAGTAGSDTDQGEAGRSINVADQIAHEEAVKKVFNSLTIGVPKDSYTISVLAKGGDPILVQQIVQAIMDEYGALHVAAHQSTGSLDFFEKQCQDSRDAALGAVTNLQQARQDMGWMSTESAEKLLQERMVELELSLDQAESNLADAESRTEALQQRLAGIKAWIPMETMQVANEAADLMRSQLYEAQLQDGEKLAKLTSSHPRYKLLREKINSGTQIVDSVGKDREQSTKAINPVRVELETQFEVALAKAAGLRSRRDSIQESLAAAKADAKRLSKDTVVLSELAWRADIAEKTYLDHSKRLESTRVIHELDQREMSDMSIIQNASLNLKKVGPPRAMLIGLSGLLGLCVGVLQALVRDNPIGNRVRTDAGSSAGAFDSDSVGDFQSGQTITEQTVASEDIEPKSERVSIPR